MSPPTYPAGRHSTWKPTPPTAGRLARQELLLELRREPQLLVHLAELIADAARVVPQRPRLSSLSASIACDCVHSARIIDAALAASASGGHSSAPHGWVCPSDPSVWASVSIDAT